MTNYSVTTKIQVTTDIDREGLQSLIDQGLKELPSVASRYGITITDGSATVED